MSHTDHPRRRRIPGHRTAVRRARLYGGGIAEQSRCTCGEVGPTRDNWTAAHVDGQRHLADKSKGES